MKGKRKKSEKKGKKKKKRRKNENENKKIKRWGVTLVKTRKGAKAGFYKKR